MFNILIVDDDPCVCIVFAAILKRLGHVTEAATNGKEAMDLFNQKPDAFDVVITDHRMPVASGLELVDHLRKHFFKGKIIVISGCLTSDLETAYQARQIDKIMQKPFTIEEVTHALQNLFDGWKKILQNKNISHHKPTRDCFYE